VSPSCARKARRCHIRTVRQMGHSNNRIFSEKFPEAFERRTRQLSRCKLSRRKSCLRPSRNTANSNGSKI
jgi:hypothetical protein